MDPHDRRRDAVTARPASPQPDLVAAYLAEVHERESRAIDGSAPARAWLAAYDSARLLAAVEAALAHIRSGDDSPQDGIAAITAALLGEDAEQAPPMAEDDWLFEHQGSGVCNKGRRHLPPCDFGNGL